MQIIHRISTASSPIVRRELASMGIVVADNGLVTFEVDEDNDAWPALRSWIEREGAVDIVRTEFSGREIEKASWLEMQPTWHHGYPQPNEDEFGYRSVTFDEAKGCSVCGIHGMQRAPFQMRGEPRWGRNSILQLNWVFDEYFVTPATWRSFFEPRQITCRPVHDAKGRTLATVVQLVVGERVEIATDGLASERCSKCEHIKFAPHARGRFPQIITPPGGPIAKTAQYFGSGASAFQCILVSQDLARALRETKVRGVSFRPVAGS